MPADTMRVRKRYRVTTTSDHDQPVAPNLLDRQFTAEKPNQRLTPISLPKLCVGREGAARFAGCA